MISGAGLCWQHVGGVGSTTTTTTLVAHQGPGGKVVFTVHRHHVVVSVCVVAV